MDKNFLLHKASQLQEVSSSSCEEYAQKAEQFVGLMNQIMINKPDIKTLIGENNLDMMKDNHANHVRFMISVFKNYNPEVFVETVLWVFRAYRSHGFSTNYWAAQLNAWFSIIKEQLSHKAYSEIAPFYEWIQVNIPLFFKLSDEKLDSSKSLH